MSAIKGLTEPRMWRSSCAYAERRTQEDLSKMEIIRSSKRYLMGEAAVLCVLACKTYAEFDGL